MCVGCESACRTIFQIRLMIFTEFIRKERGKSKKRPGELLDGCEVSVSHSVVSDSL